MTAVAHSNDPSDLAETRMVRVRILSGIRNVQICSGAHTASYSIRISVVPQE
jgi:hypothetical protein